MKPAEFPTAISRIEVGSSSSADVRYVTFKSSDGIIEYGKKAVAVGDDCADPVARGVFTTPTKQSDAQYSYTFYGWATTPNGGSDANWNKSIKEDKTVYANFASAVRYYTITFYDDDGTTVLKTESLAYGSTPSYTPKKDGYAFVDWQPELETVTGNASYTASWVEKLQLKDYTWEEINAMTLSEMKENFAIGDKKDSYVLVGFQQDTLTSGGKARMTFIYESIAQSTQLGANNLTNYHGINHYKYMTSSNPGGYINKYQEISPVAKAVNKKYVTDRTNLSIGTESLKFWIPAASELGYNVDGTTILNEGSKYDYFSEKNFSGSMSVDNQTMGFGKRALRSLNATELLYLESGTLKKLSSGAVSSVYYFYGFCI